MFPYELHMPPTSTHDDSDSDSLFDSYIDSSNFDQSFCSNFSCCGQNLPDLHHLLDHFEEEHVLPLPNDDRPLYSSPVYAQPRPSGAHASYIISYPQPDPPLQPLSHPILGPPGVLPDIDFPRIRSIPELTYSPHSVPSSATTSCYSSPSLGEPLCLPPALFSVQASRLRTPPPPRDDQEGTPKDRRRTVGPQRTAKHYPSARVDPIARSRPLVRTPERAPPPSVSVHRRKDGREKQFKCPHPGCMKSYLNPNGLKYHLEKGTCTNADARARGPLPPQPQEHAQTPAPPTPVVPTPTPTRMEEIPIAQAQAQVQIQTKTPALPSAVKIDVIDVDVPSPTTPSLRSVIDVDAEDSDADHVEDEDEDHVEDEDGREGEDGDKDEGAAERP